MEAGFDCSGEYLSSFRDPGGRLIRHENRVLRLVTDASLAQLRGFLDSIEGREAVERGDVISSVFLTDGERASLQGQFQVNGQQSEAVAAIVEHPLIWFPSYPYEWPAEMLHSAAQLTIDLARRLGPAGFWLKDATPSNILFRGTRPIFVDVLSFEKRPPCDSIWRAYAQFVRTFLLPLLSWRKFRIPPGWILLARRDGLEPEEMARWLGPVEQFFPPALSLATLPSWLSGVSSEATYRTRPAGSAEKAEFIFERLINGLARQVRRLAPPQPRSRWSGYLNTQQHYGEAQFRFKEEFTLRVLRETHPTTVLDVGSNTGHFSLMAAREGASVVAIDSDPASAGLAWRAASAEGLDVQSLAVDLARPTPATGWMNSECPSFLERAEGKFDLVLMLAVVHHLIVSERVPLADILALVARLTRCWLLIEYVDPADPMFVRIARGRDALHKDLNRANFETACRKRFDIVHSEPIEGTQRRLYLLRKSAV